jgi:hypothetical protein
VSERIKVFLSWSGDRAKAVAAALHEAMSTMTDLAEPFMSEIDIEAGQRSLKEIEEAIEGTRFAVVIVTPERHDSMWLNFEAGALSRAVNGEESRVVPLLVGMEKPTDLTGPIAQFQGKLWGREGIQKLFYSLDSVIKIGQGVIDKRIPGVWEELDSRTKEAIAAGPAPIAPRRDELDLLEELLELTRAIHRDGQRPTAVETHSAGAVIDSGGISSRPFTSRPWRTQPADSRALKSRAILDRETDEFTERAHAVARRIGLTPAQVGWDGETRRLALRVKEDEVTEADIEMFDALMSRAGIKGTILSATDPREVW